MFRSTLWLTAAALAGLIAGFAREWLLVSHWGAGSRSDAFLVAIFLPEAIRMTMAGGLLAAAALPLYVRREEADRVRWLNGITPWLLLSASLLGGLLAVAAPLWVGLIGPGLDSDAQQQAIGNLSVLAACAPGFALHALLSIPLHARQRFVLAGLGSLLFNLPTVFYLWLQGEQSQPSQLALSCVLGSILMPLSLALPSWRQGWRPWCRDRERDIGTELLCRLKPLLGSNLASYGLALIERSIASYMGEGVVTWLNLARKLVNLPVIALMNLNQVLLGMLSSREAGQRQTLLKQGLALATMLSLPAALGLTGAAPTIVAWLLPGQSVHGPLPGLLAWFAAVLAFGSWNALLARYSYADGNTTLPLHCELWGSGCNAALLLTLPFLTGNVTSIALAALGGVITTAALLMHRQTLLTALDWKRQALFGAILLMLFGALLHPLQAGWPQFGLSATASAVTLVGLAIWLKPWRALDVADDRPSE
jgi:peptidoglycan biosynthesis protein MviN/MurJ (putative lipid II flippase)